MKQYVIKTAAFSLIFLLLFEFFTICYVPVYFEDSDWPTTGVYQAFYSLKKNTVDAVFLGSSAGNCGFIPQELYNQYGITSYNLSCEQQNLISSYYWLRECLRFQKPKAVVLECKFLFESDREKLTEPWFRKALTYMRWSSVKKEAVETVCDILPDESEISWIIPMIRFHSRWEETNEAESFTHYLSMTDKHHLMGYFPKFTSIGKGAAWNMQQNGDDVRKANPSRLELDYLDKIVALCRNRGMTLILTYTPCEMTKDKHVFLEEYAEAAGIPFIDFNDNVVMEKISYSVSTDNESKWHANVSGARKLTDYIGEYLSSGLAMEAHRDSQWEKTKNAYENVEKDYLLASEKEPETYLTLLSESRDRYIVFLSIYAGDAERMNDRVKQQLTDLGLNLPLKKQWNQRYFAVLTKDGAAENEEEKSGQKLEISGRLAGGSSYRMESGVNSVIYLNDKPYSLQRTGLSIVVYDTYRCTVIDTVSYDPKSSFLLR